MGFTWSPLKKGDMAKKDEIDEIVSKMNTILDELDKGLDWPNTTFAERGWMYILSGIEDLREAVDSLDAIKCNDCDSYNSFEKDAACPLAKQGYDSGFHENYFADEHATVDTYDYVSEDVSNNTGVDSSYFESNQSGYQAAFYETNYVDDDGTAKTTDNVTVGPPNVCGSDDSYVYGGEYATVYSSENSSYYDTEYHTYNQNNYENNKYSDYSGDDLTYDSTHYVDDKDSEYTGNYSAYRETENAANNGSEYASDGGGATNATYYSTNYDTNNSDDYTSVQSGHDSGVYSTNYVIVGPGCNGDCATVNSSNYVVESSEECGTDRVSNLSPDYVTVGPNYCDSDNTGYDSSYNSGVNSGENSTYKSLEYVNYDGYNYALNKSGNYSSDDSGYDSSYRSSVNSSEYGTYDSGDDNDYYSTNYTLEYTGDGGGSSCSNYNSSYDYGVDSAYDLSGG